MAKRIMIAHQWVPSLLAPSHTILIIAFEINGNLRSWKKCQLGTLSSLQQQCTFHIPLTYCLIYLFDLLFDTLFEMFVETLFGILFEVWLEILFDILSETLFEILFEILFEMWFEILFEILYEISLRYYTNYRWRQNEIFDIFVHFTK